MTWSSFIQNTLCCQVPSLCPVTPSTGSKDSRSFCPKDPNDGYVSLDYDSGEYFSLAVSL